MRIVTVRRVSQVFFFTVFMWFCVVTTLGERSWQLRGWPVNWILELDPLAGIATLLSTRTLYAGLLWGLATVALTVLLVWSFDRIGHHWRYYERSPRPPKKTRRRARATMQAMNAEQQATVQAMRRREQREAQRRRDRERAEAMREGRGPGGGGQAG
jgi:hypothetical protein